MLHTCQHSAPNSLGPRCLGWQPEDPWFLPPLHTGDSRPQEVEAGDLRPLVAGAVDHALKQPLDPPAPHQWLAASGRDSPGLSDKDGDEAGELSTHWA